MELVLNGREHVGAEPHGRHCPPAMNLLASIARLAIARPGWLIATGDARDAEILALHRQLLVLQRQVSRPKFTDTGRTILAVLSTAIDRARHTQAILIVQPAS